MNSAFSYFGGKARLIPDILQQFPFYMDTYIEPFCGSAAVFFAAPGRWANIEILNDLNDDLINFFRVLRDEPDELIRRLNLTPNSRAEYNDDWEKIEQGTWKDKIDRALCFFVKIEQSFSNTARRYSWKLPASGDAHRWELKTNCGRLIQVSTRLKQAFIENYPAQKIISLYDDQGTFFYLDPPYLSCHSDISAPYAGLDMSVDQHSELIEMLKNIKGMALISGYNHPTYDTLLESGWKKTEIETVTNINNSHATLKPKQRTEILWANPALQKCRSQLVLFEI